MLKKTINFCSVAILAIISSCSKGGGEAEFITLTPKALEAAYSVSTYTVEVQSNCAWKTAVVDAAGAEITWATPDKKSGHNNTRINLRVLENPSMSARNAILVLTSDNGTQARVDILQKGNPDSPIGDDKIKVRIGSYNLRQTTITETDQNNAWTNRKPRVMQSIKDNAFDVFGVQECDTKLQTDLAAGVGDIYDMYFFSPYSQDGKGSRAHGILYKKAAFTISDTHFFWMGPNPEQMSTSDTGSEGNFNRGGFCTVVTHKATGIKFFMMVTHACLNSEPNATYAPIYQTMEKKYNTAGLPSIFVGDMNAVPTADASTEYLKWWKDVFKELPTGQKTGPAGTFNGFDLNRQMSSAKRLDYIYYRNGAEPQAYTCNQAKYGGYYASDHLPIYAEFIIKATVPQQ